MLIVDRMLPELDGLSLVRTLRTTNNNTPVLFLSALGQVDAGQLGLRWSGGDDYLAKPYASSELLAQIKSARPPPARGFSSGAGTVLRYDDLVTDLLARRVSTAGARSTCNSAS